MCLLLARFEQWFRTGGFNLALLELLVEPLEQWFGDELDDLIQRLGFGPSTRDLTVLSRVAAADHERLRSKRPLHFNPNFGLSVELGGADADLIAGGALIDWKATTTRQPVGRQSLWQLLGYVLADENDHYRVRSVSIGALRWRATVEWPLEEFLPALAGGSPGDLADLRSEFASVVRARRADTDELRMRAERRAANLARKAARRDEA